MSKPVPPEARSSSETGLNSLGTLIGRDTHVEIVQTAHGTRYDVYSVDLGIVIGEGLTEAELEEMAPDFDPDRLNAGQPGIPTRLMWAGDAADASGW